MAECFVVGLVTKSVSFNTYRSDSSSWILTALWVAVSTKVDISYDESGMAKDILLKPWVEATELDISKSKNQREHKNCS